MPYSATGVWANSVSPTGQSKTANALFAVGMTQRHGADGITANAVHPGGIMTGIQRHLRDEDMRALGWIDDNGVPNPLFKPTEQGAATSIWAAVAPELQGIGGHYLEDCAIAKAWSADALGQVSCSTRSTRKALSDCGARRSIWSGKPGQANREARIHFVHRVRPAADRIQRRASPTNRPKDHSTPP